MNRWIVFDQTTAHAVKSRLGAEPELRAAPPGDVLALALESPAAVAVLPAGNAGKALVIRAELRKRPASTTLSRNLAPAGFLGLSDSIDMDTEPEPPKKWWRKITG